MPKNAIFDMAKTHTQLQNGADIVHVSCTYLFKKTCLMQKESFKLLLFGHDSDLRQISKVLDNIKRDNI